MKLRDLDVKDKLFSQLTVDWDPGGERLRHYLILVKLLILEPFSIGIGQDKLPLEPFLNLFVTLTLNWAVGSILAFLEFKHKTAGSCRVIITLNP